MKNKNLPIAFFIFGLFTVTGVFAQSDAYFSVTGEQFGSTNWMVFREGYLSGNTPVKTLYVPAPGKEIVYDALSGKQITNDNVPTSSVSSAPALTTPATVGQSCGCISNNMVAAIAFDAKNNRLYYTQMAGDQLRYFNLNETPLKSYAVTTQLLKNFPAKPGEASVITRMCIAPGNYGYALTNDNEHLIRFSTDGKNTITDLGKLIDAKSNQQNSVTTQFKSWGGDLIADADGNLYLFTIQRGVFKINPNTRLATFLGQVKNIPDDYTVNAAMAEGDENVIVGSSTQTTNYYRVSLNTLTATVLNKTTEQVYNVSDFANSHFAFENKESTVSDAFAKTLVANSVNVYPNPVSKTNLNVQFTNFTPGKYTIQLSESEGKTLIQRKVDVAGSQTESLTVTSITAGTYLLRIVNEKGENISTTKVAIGR
jgi:hypothetical protein